jgi:predicted Rossmann fold nucleotide-binding protein DprA/Smf involved in DNA uptake
MHVVGVTGTRKLSESEAIKAAREMRSLLDKATKLHVGDATGIDAIAHRCACTLIEYE